MNGEQCAECKAWDGHHKPGCAERAVPDRRVRAMTPDEWTPEVVIGPMTDIELECGCWIRK